VIGLGGCGPRRLSLCQLGSDLATSLAPANRAGFAPPALGATLVVAGLYQFTPLKRVCLSHCRLPLAFVAQHWCDGWGGALFMGLRHGTYCLGGCWALFAVLVATGVMNLAWMLLLTLIVFVEKLLPHGRRSAAVIGIALVALGLLVAAGAVPMPWMAWGPPIRPVGSSAGYPQTAGEEHGRLAMSVVDVTRNALEDYGLTVESVELIENPIQAVNDRIAEVHYAHGVQATRHEHAAFVGTVEVLFTMMDAGGLSFEPMLDTSGLVSIKSIGQEIRVRQRTAAGWAVYRFYSDATPALWLDLDFNCVVPPETSASPRREPEPFGAAFVSRRATSEAPPLNALSLQISPWSTRACPPSLSRKPVLESAARAVYRRQCRPVCRKALSRLSGAESS
jgi:hypothetical protein